MDVSEEVRRLCRLSSTLWVDGDGIGARQALYTAQKLVSAMKLAPSEEFVGASSTNLRLEVLAASGRLFLRAEESGKALLASDAALDLAGQVELLDEYGRAAALDAQVTNATEALNHAPTPSARQVLLEALDAVRDECLTGGVGLPFAGEIAGRAINNALLLRLKPLYEGLNYHQPETQVQAWLWVGKARAAITTAELPDIDLQPVNRQAVDLARRLGSWERAWEAVTESLRVGYQRNEKVSLLAKAARLAWERGNLPDAIAYGQKARTSSIAVDLPWVRLYAYQAGVIAAAAGAGPVKTALEAYQTCVNRNGHATRPDRAWETAQIALDADATVNEIKAFLHHVGFNEHAYRHRQAFAAVILADHIDETARQKDWDDVDLALLSAPDRARYHLAAARTALRQGHRSAAAIELSKGREYLRHWPGRTAAALNHLAAKFLDSPPVTPSQRIVLNLLVEGLSNNAIAAELGTSARTVAVHVQALPRTTGATSRTDLALRELRRRLTAYS